MVMELVTLNNQFQLRHPFDNYDSLVWAERYSKNGDFQLVSSNITEAVNALPRESYISLRDSATVMIVEDHKLVKPLKDTPQVVITGRTLETVLDRRTSVNALPSNTPRIPWMIEAVKASDAAFLATRIVIGDTQQVNSSGVVLLPGISPAVSSLDTISELQLVLPKDYVDLYNSGDWSSTYSYIPGQQVRWSGFLWVALVNNTNNAPSGAFPNVWKNLGQIQNFEIKPQNLYSTVMELVNINHHGIKITRPSTTTAARAKLEIYNGADLTATQVFDARFDQIDSATYLLSARGSANVAYVFGPNGAQQVLKNTVEMGGINRRVIALDETNDSDAEDPNVRYSRGLIELYKYNATALFDGQVSDQIAAGYNRDYFLGDILNLVGEYGLTQKVRVAEFIRSEDSSGYKAYPGFEAVDE